MPPKYQKIAERIYEDVLRDSENAAKALPSERTLAELFRCSRVTIRTALNVLAEKGLITNVGGNGRIAVNDAVPTIQAKENNNAYVSHFAVVIFRGNHLIHIYSKIASVIRDILPDDAWSVSFWHIDPEKRISKEYPKAMEQASAFFVTGNYTLSDLAWFCNQQKPLIVLGQAGDDVLRNFGHSHIHVFYDMCLAYERVVDFLWSRGYRRPAILINSTHKADLDRYEGFRRSLVKHGQNPDDFVSITASSIAVTSQDRRKAPYNAVDNILEKQAQFDALITNSYDVLLCEMYKRRLFVPEDFALVGQVSDKDKFMEGLGITEIRVDHVAATRCAMNIFMDKFHANQYQGWHGRELVLTPEFIIRDSCPELSHCNGEARS